MDAAPKSKKPRRKSSTRKTNHLAEDEILVEDHPATVIAPKNARYVEPSTLAIHSGTELAQDQAFDDPATRDAEGTLDADLAELSLGQRLSALNGTITGNKGSESDNDEGHAAPSKPDKQQDSLHIVPAHSLTRTLIQALHSSDSRLLETCLAHSDTMLIRNTMRRLPPQLSLPLLLACMERLGRGARAANMKGGGGGGASSQRGTVLINWIKTTLTIHSGHLMTMPDLVARLAGLHAMLTTRLILHESLLSLNGKLDTVLSQIEMRSSSAPASLASKSRSPIHQDNARRPTRYVEGDSEEDDQMNIDPPVENGDEEGSVEDVELGGESDDSENEDEGVDVDIDEDTGEDESVGEFGDGNESDGPFNEFAEEDEDDEDDSE